MLTLITFDWLPEFPRGYVRDMRVRWLLEELERPYRVETVPAMQKSEAHRLMQPFAQVPVIRDGDLTLFESGAILIHLAEGSALMPAERRPEILQWVCAALNTVEISVAGWMLKVLAGQIPEFFGPAPAPEVTAHARREMETRLAQLESAIADRDWLAGGFSVADLLMVEVLRPAASAGALDGFAVLSDYVARATARPAFGRAMADHMAHWQAADAARAAPLPA